MKILKSQLKELVRQSIEELKFGSQAQYDAYKKKHDIKPGTKVKVGDKTTTHKGKAKLSKKSKSAADRMAAKLNKKMDKMNKKAKQGKSNQKPDAAEKMTDKEKKKNISKKDKDTLGKLSKLMKKESVGKRCTVKEIKKWMKTLEENRYKKTYNSDARRVSWLVNNEGVELSEMPKSMKKKWTKAQYGREIYLAREFIKHLESKQMNENKLEEKLRGLIREVIKKELNEGKFKKVILPNDMKTKKVVSKMIKKLKLKIDKDYDVKALKARGGDQVISILPKHYNKFIELAMQNKLKPRG